MGWGKWILGAVRGIADPLLGRASLIQGTLRGPSWEEESSILHVHPANGISLFSVERENVQKRTFTRWVNLHLEKVSGALGFLLSDRFIWGGVQFRSVARGKG